jgi:hypothetical protein
MANVVAALSIVLMLPILLIDNAAVRLVLVLLIVSCWFVTDSRLRPRGQGFADGPELRGGARQTPASRFEFGARLATLVVGLVLAALGYWIPLALLLGAYALSVIFLFRRDGLMALRHKRPPGDQ